MEMEYALKLIIAQSPDAAGLSLSDYARKRLFA